MRTVTLYPKQTDIIYTVSGSHGARQGIIMEKELEQFFSENPPAVLNVILPKPRLVFRRLEFPFSGRRNIRLVIPHELENVLPEPPENYLYWFEFCSSAKNKTAVNVYAVKNTDCLLWKNLAKKYTSKVFFFSDTVLLHLLLKQYASENSLIGIYGLHDYFLVNLEENSLLSGSYSYDFKISDSVRTKELLSDFLSRKELRVFLVAEEAVSQELDIPPDRRQEINPFPQIEKKFLFHNLIAINPYRKPLHFRKLHHAPKFPVFETVLAAVFLAITALSLSPYFRIPARERQVKEIDRKMGEILLAACPHVTRIVNPLAQIKEEIAEWKSADDVISGYPSVLKIMAELTALIPETSAASVDQFTISGDTLTISGSTGSLRALETIKEKIESSKNFSIVDMGTISFDSSNRVNFNITLGIAQ